MILGEQVMEEIGSGQAHLAAKWPFSAQRLLEVGCSSGYLTHRLLEKAERTFGVDINFRALTDAQSRHPNVPVVCSDVEHLPFAESSFDAIVMLEVVEHTRSDKAALAEIRRVLKPGGILVLSTPNAGLFAFLDPYNLRRSFERWFPRLCALVGRLVRFEGGQFTENLERHRHYRLSEIAVLLGPEFKIRAVHRGGLLLYPLAAACISVAGRLWKSTRVLRCLYRLLKFDFDLRFGPLSYNLMVVAERLRFER